jgi:hypothetical protein
VRLSGIRLDTLGTATPAPEKLLYALSGFECGLFRVEGVEEQVVDLAVDVALEATKDVEVGLAVG